VGIVNEAFVARILGGRRDVVGTRLAMAVRLPIYGDVPWDTRRIVGVVNDSVYRSVRDSPKPAMYSPLAQLSAPLQFTNFFIVVRSRTTAPQMLSRELAAALNALHDDLRLRFQPVSEQVEHAIAQDRLVAAISLFVGGLALLLAAIGLYGVTSYNVERQRAEIGIRLALGAQPSGVLRLVLSRVAILVGMGVAIGALASAWASKFAAALLFQVPPRNPVALAGAVAMMGLVAAVAAGLPARRASRIDPADVLRES
jgi:ABC-type antimicrobial peptide transport system permease subunit